MLERIPLIRSILISGEKRTKQKATLIKENTIDLTNPILFINNGIKIMGISLLEIAIPKVRDNKVILFCPRYQMEAIKKNIITASKCKLTVNSRITRGFNA